MLRMFYKCIYKQWIVVFRKTQFYNCNVVCKKIFIPRIRALFNLYAHTVAVIRLHLSKEVIEPNFNYGSIFLSYYLMNQNLNRLCSLLTTRKQKIISVTTFAIVADLDVYFYILIFQTDSFVIARHFGGQQVAGSTGKYINFV